MFDALADQSLHAPLNTTTRRHRWRHGVSDSRAQPLPRR
jgi:hypothetical protein